MFFDATNALFTTFCFFGNKSKLSFYNHNLQHVQTSKVGQKVGSYCELGYGVFNGLIFEDLK